LREAELDLFLENFRAIADERMADIVVTPEFKARVLRSALESPEKGRVVSVFSRKRVVWSSVAVAAALLVAAIGGSRWLSGGEALPESSREIAVADSASNPPQVYEYGIAPEEGVSTDRAISDEEEPSIMLAPSPEPVPQPAAIPEGQGEEPERNGETGDRQSSSGKTQKGGAGSGGEQETPEEPQPEGEIIADAAEQDFDEAVKGEADGLADVADDQELDFAACDPEADAEAGDCLLAEHSIACVIAVFTGEVVSTQVLAISLKDGSTVSEASAESFLPDPDQPVREDDGVQYLLPVYGYPDGENVYVVVTSYKVESVHAGEVTGDMVRVLVGRGGIIGSRDVVAVSGVQNAPYGETEIRYDLVADYAAVLIDGDLSSENIHRIAGMANGE
jgi:hypothetical protein